MDKNYNKEIGQWMAIKRKEKKLSQRQVAEILGVSKSTIAFWETGERSIFAAYLIDFCKAINVDPQEIVDDLMHK